MDRCTRVGIGLISGTIAHLQVEEKRREERGERREERGERREEEQRTGIRKHYFKGGEISTF